MSSSLSGGKYINYLVHRYRTKKQLKSIKPRFNRDLNKDLKDPYENGVYSRPQDLTYERPSKSEPENIFLYAANENNQMITLNLQWIPNPDENCGLIKVNLSLNGFQPGVIYEYRRSERIYNLDNYDNYSVGGFKLETIVPLKRVKLRLNDFCLSKNDPLSTDDQHQLSDRSDNHKYVRLIGLLLPVQEVFDHLTTFNSKFISSQLTSLSQKFPLFDMVDIGSHVKLYIQIDQQQSAIETDLWGLRCKLRSTEVAQFKPGQLIKFSGYAFKKGYNFSITFIEANNSWYVNGFSGWGSSFIFPIVKTSGLTKDLFSSDVDTPFNFKIENEYRAFNVTGKTKADSIYSIEIDNCPGIGHCVRLPFTGNEPFYDTKIVDSGPLIGSVPSYTQTNDLLIVGLDQPVASNSILTGGKGSSLAKLTSILTDYPQLGQVPMGCVVTTSAYQLMAQTINLPTLICKLKQTISSSNQIEGRLEAECSSIVNQIGSSNLPDSIREAIESALGQIFGSNWVKNKKLAVRSSAYGEDSNELSCAGQMETFLGISSLEQVSQCIMKCWASQFRYVAIKYKLLNGLDLNLNMAVVIQEMVDCDQAGVLFTCDPVSNNPLSVLITANHGLGESIVSSASDPDTIKVKLEMSSNGLTIDSIEDIQIGTKEKIIKLSETGEGTVTIDSQSSKSQSCCLTENQIINLTTTCLKVASFFNEPCDIEWGIQSDQIYLFQCRPVTTISSTLELTDWELSHEMDSPHVGSNEYNTRANLGEVYPGTTSYICQDYQIPTSTIAYVKKVFAKNDRFQFLPYVARGMVFCRHHSFFALKDGIIFVYDTSPDKENMLSTSMEYAMLGQKIDDYEMKADSYERLSQFKFQTGFQKLKSTLDLVFMSSKRLAKVNLLEFASNATSKSSSREILTEIICNPDYLWDIFSAHLSVTIASSIMNIFAISILSKADRNSPTIFTDFSKLLASCEQVVSAQVPILLKELASKVNDEKERKLILEGSNSEIEEYLNIGTSQLASNYRQFIKDYGHRGWKEFDWSGKVWRKDPSSVISSLRSLIQQQTAASNNTNTVKTEKNKITDDELIDSLETPLSKTSKFLLKKLVLPWCRKFVCLREEGKNKLIWKIDQMRKLFDQMANTLTFNENRLPDPSLAYYLTPDELFRLTQANNPGLVLLAKRRQKICTKTLDSYEFPIILVGPKMLPNNMSNEDYEINCNNYSGQEIIGTPVSQGKIISSVHVARKIEEVAGIKPGDILITYSTDIGWSPYFPIIGGLITEIGGLISHGAVIAREFGLPCVVGVPNACKIFKTGEKVSMDASRGVITKLID